MSVIEQQKWQEVMMFTWSELAPRLWEDFRLVLMELKTELEAHGVSIEQTYATYELHTEQETQGVKIVHSPIISEAKTEMITSIVVSERDYKTEMLKYLPLYERKSSIFDEIITAYDRELRNTEQQLEVVERNYLIDTAIEALPIYERDLGIQTNRNLSYDQRREQISSRYRASFEQTTEETIKNVASAFGNGEVEINETNTIGIYEIKFIGVGIPNNLDGLTQALDIIFPAHLGYKYSFTFNTWEFISDKSWLESATMTWDELRTWNEVS